MNYSDYLEFDFATNDEFIEWVKFPDAGSNLYWQSWIEKNPDKLPVITRARKILLSIDFQEYQWADADKEKLKEKILSSIEVHGAKVIPIKNTIRRRRWPYQVAAAVVVGLVLLGYALFFMPANEKLVAYETNSGEIKKINLPDQSTITLNENSTLNYREDNDLHQRIATLTGEGYFKVKSNPLSPFNVIIDNVVVQVVGTEFNVRSNGDIISVALQSGKINLVISEEKEDGIVKSYIEMKPGQVIEYSDSLNRIVKNEITNVSTYSKWKNRILVFEKTTLREVASRLYNNYGVTLQLPEHLLDQTFTARISIEDGDLNTLLKLLSESFKLDFKRVKNTIYATEQIDK